MLVTWPYLEFGVKRVIVETWLMRCMMLPSVHSIWFKGDRLRGTISKFWAIHWDT